MNVVEEKKTLYIDTIMNVAKSNYDSKKKSEDLAELLSRYYKFCYDNKIKAYDSVLGELENISYIVDSEPILFDVDEEKTTEAVEHLKEALNNGGGITEEEARLLLDWSIQKTRKILSEKSEVGIDKDSLNGLCGYCQMLTLTPFQDIGVKTTVNNAYKFGQHVHSHAFGTVTLPIEENGTVTDKDYLLDASYRQFFTTLRCNEGRYYDLNYKSSPDCGYYLINYLNGKDVANEILKNGYIELTDDALKKYATAFVATKLNIDTKDTLGQVLNTDLSTLKNTIQNNQTELDFDRDEIKEELKIIEFPNKQNKTK